MFNYRSVGIPQDFLGPHDCLRTNFVYNGAPDFVLVFFAGTDWANYTREYPAGSFYVYIRSSGDGPFSMYLDQVVSGAGTVNQVTKDSDTLAVSEGPVYVTYDWVPLTDDGLAAPAVVKLNGVTTLRLTTAGNCNPNYFMLVPAAGITLRAASSAGNTVLSFPSQTGVNYRVFYRTNLTTGNWTLLTAVLGNGAVKSVSDPATEPADSIRSRPHEPPASRRARLRDAFPGCFLDGPAMLRLGRNPRDRANLFAPPRLYGPRGQSQASLTRGAHGRRLPLQLRGSSKADSQIRSQNESGAD